jgi:hypothetical protein
VPKTLNWTRTVTLESTQPPNAGSMRHATVLMYRSPPSSCGMLNGTVVDVLIDQQLVRARERERARATRDRARAGRHAHQGRRREELVVGAVQHGTLIGERYLDDLRDVRIRAAEHALERGDRVRGIS